MKKLKNPKALFLDYSQTIDDVYENSKKTLTQQRKGECQQCFMLWQQIWNLIKN